MNTNQITKQQKLTNISNKNIHDKESNYTLLSSNAVSSNVGVSNTYCYVKYPEKNENKTFKNNYQKNLNVSEKYKSNSNYSQIIPNHHQFFASLPIQNTSGSILKHNLIQHYNLENGTKVAELFKNPIHSLNNEKAYINNSINKLNAPPPSETWF